MEWRRSLWILAFGAMISSASYTMVTPFLPIYLLDLGVQADHINLWAGFVFAATFLFSAIMAPYWGRRADRNGRRRMILRAGYCLALAYLLAAFVRSPIELLLARALQGLISGFVPASLAMVAATVPQDEMGASLGFMQTALLVGGIMGPLAGGVLSHLYGLRLPFVIASVTILAATLAVRALVKEPPIPPSAVRSNIMDDLKTAFSKRSLVVMLLLMFLVQVATIILQPLMVLYVAQLQNNLEGAGLASGIIYSLAGIAGAIAAPLWGKLGQRQGYVNILIIAFMGAGVLIASQFFVTGIYGFSVVHFLFGLFIVGVYPSINTIAVSASGRDFQGRTFGLTTMANQFGSMTGPLLGGFISSWIGIRPVFLFSGMVLIMAGLLMVYLRDRLFGRQVA